MHKLIIDSDGENRAVRGFLLAYGPSCEPITVGGMCQHLYRYGQPFWPADIGCMPFGATLTKGIAQRWIRYLFSLEAPERHVGAMPVTGEGEEHF